MTQLKSVVEMFCQVVLKKREEKRIEEEQADLSESNEEFSSTDDDSFSFDKIDYVEA
nr:hypothetical protein [Tanacetum cinerariifolium]